MEGVLIIAGSSAVGGFAEVAGLDVVVFKDLLTEIPFIGRAILPEKPIKNSATVG